jgi:hypothetical protein
MNYDIFAWIGVLLAGGILLYTFSIFLPKDDLHKGKH